MNYLIFSVLTSPNLNIVNAEDLVIVFQISIIYENYRHQNVFNSIEIKLIKVDSHLSFAVFRNRQPKTKHTFKDAGFIFLYKIKHWIAGVSFFLNFGNNKS